MPVPEPCQILDNSSYSFQSIEPARLPLVDRFYRDLGYKIKCAPHERVFVLVNNTGDFIAAARLVPQLSGHYWLRNLLVDPQWRGQGLATRLITECKPHIFPLGCYCFALPHLTELYRRLDFAVAPDHCPADILANYQKYRARGRDWVLMGYKAQ